MTPRKRRAAPSAAPRIRPHPFAATASLLRESWAAAGLPPLHPDGIPLPLIAQVPSRDDAPLHSAAAPLGPDDPSQVVLLPWRLDGLPLSPIESVQRLLGLAALEASGDLAIGDDLRYWLSVARFALSLLLRQRLMPTVRPRGTAFLARWQPLLDDPDDAQRYVALAQGMPHVCRALAVRRAATAPLAADLLRDYLDTLVDALARGAAAPHSPALPRNVRRLGPPSLGDRWLQALHESDSSIEGTRIELERFAEQYATWAGLGEAPSGAANAFRVLFRLDPPVEPDGVEDGEDLGSPGIGHAPAEARWTLRYLLQATDDPSLQVPVGEVWRQRGRSGRFLNRRFDHPQEQVLASLGRAAQLFPPIEDSLRSSRPEAGELTTAQAYEFVSERALLLRAAGFAVQVPGLERSLSVRLTLGKSSGSSSNKGGGPPTLTWDSLVAYDWQLALGDQALTRGEFEELAALKEPLVQVRGRWVELRPEQVAQALAFFDRQARRGLALADALALALAPDADVGLPVGQVQAAGDFAALLATLQGAGREDLAEPPGFAGQLRPYQRAGLSWLAALRRFGLGACLADDMGLGKTVQVIALLLRRRQEATRAATVAAQAQPTTRRSAAARGAAAAVATAMVDEAAAVEEVAPALLVCPTSVVGNWRRELERFAPTLRVLVHHGANRVREGFAEEVAGCDVVVSTYSLLARDAETLGGVEWDALILDEAQNIKNASTKAAQAARGMRARWRAALTGTPVENRLSELWSIFQFLNPGYLGSAERFRAAFVVPIERTGDTAAAERLKRLAGPFILRRLKTDRSIIQDLPEKNEMKVFCTLTPEQGTLYEATLQDAMRAVEESEGIERRGKILGVLTRLKQICDHPALFLHDGSALAGRSGKLARLAEMLEEVVEVGDRALIFTQYAEMGALLKEYLAERFTREVLFLSGATPIAERDRMVARFQEEARGPQIFILSIKAGGTGLNLTRANHVFHFDRWWNPAVENQATDRAFRIGQRRDVQVHKYICAGTFEEKLDAIIDRKLALSESIVGAGENWITEMSGDELRDLFALRRDAVQGE